MNGTPPPDRQLLLAGGGHSHALVLRRWAMRPERRPRGCRIALVSRSSTAFYSGMVPGLVAGLYQQEECAIDLRALCRRAGVTFVQAEIVALNTARRWLVLAGRPPLAWDLLSLDVGAETAVVEGAALAVKPLEPFLRRCGELAQGCAGERPELRIVGGGAAAVELALALRRVAQPSLQLRGERLHLGSTAANRCGERLLAQAGIAVERHRTDPASNAPTGTVSATTTLACTGSRAPAWLTASGLPADPASGRLLTDDRLRVEGHGGIFASGDCAQIAAAPRPPSGVWAVRAAPVLAANLERLLADAKRPLRRWRPQSRALQLLGDGGALTGGQPQAVALWGPFALGPSPLLWRWKELIDRRFMAGFATPAAMGDGGDPAKGSAMDGTAMACRGCAAKLAAAPLRAALERLDPSAAPDPEDAAVVGHGQDGETLLQSVDGFPALVDDPWLNGRLTTLHACSDLWACGARVASAQALVSLPRLGAGLQEELLLQTLAGVRSVLEPLGARLIGGHTLQSTDDGEELTLALTVNGEAPAGRLWAKGGLGPGDALVLSRPIGSGVLFAAARAGAVPPAWIDAALAVMGQSQAPLVELLERHGCRACTDITGFGLLGHLGEMVEAGRKRSPGLWVELDRGAIPALPGAMVLLERGFASSLAPANRSALALLGDSIQLRARGPAAEPDQRPGVLEELLVDPQTCGPLLAALPAEAAAGAVAELNRAGFPLAAVVGWVRGD